MGYTIKSDIVVPNGYVYSQSGLQPGFHQIHMHSTGNATATVQNERDYLAGHYNAANYTHLVGITNGAVDIRQVMNVNGGAWDVGGDWNWEAYAAIEFAEGSIRSQADFNKAYPAYIWLARTLAKQAGITYTIDNLNTIGIKSHNYASATGHGSDHVDPIAFLAKWGVSYDKLKHDIKNGFGATSTKTTKPAASVSKSDVDKFRAYGRVNWNNHSFKANLVEKRNGIWQAVSYELASNGKVNYNWTNNGVPLSVVTRTNNRDQSHFNAGDTFKFDKNIMPIVAYDNASNGIKVRPAGNGSLDFWVDATVAWKA